MVCRPGASVTELSWLGCLSLPAQRARTTACLNFDGFAGLNCLIRRMSEITKGGLNRTRKPHIEAMANWQASNKREAPKTKAELREMLAQAVRNTQPGTDTEPKKGKRPSKAETVTAASSIRSGGR